MSLVDEKLICILIQRIEVLEAYIRYRGEPILASSSQQVNAQEQRINKLDYEVEALQEQVKALTFR